MDPFELSRSPYFNDVIRLAREAAEDPGHPDLHAPELADRLKFMAEFAEVLASRFAAAMRVRPRTPLARSAPARVEKALVELKEALRDLQGWIKDHHPERLPRGCSRGRTAVEDLFAVFEEMRVEEESFPVFSQSPYIQELVRVAIGVAKGEFPPDTLSERLEWMRRHYGEFRKDFAAWSNAPTENEEVERLLPTAAKALDRMGAALDEMARYLRDRNREHLKVGCEALLQASEVLLSSQQALLAAAVPQGAACPRCAAPNPAGSRTCSKCGATLPEIAGIPTQTMEVREATSEKTAFANLVRLESALEEFLHGEGEREELRRHVGWFAQKARSGRKQFESMKLPEGFPSEAARQIAQATRELMDRGTRAVVQGVERLEKFFTSDEREDLQSGMERIREGAALILQAQEKALQAQAPPP
jgi:ribosomal protein L40E